MDFIDEPVDELMRVVVFIVVEECIGGLDGCDESFVVVGAAILFVIRQLLEEQVQLQQHVFFRCCASLGFLLIFRSALPSGWSIVENGLAQRQTVVKTLHSAVGVAHCCRFLSGQAKNVADQHTERAPHLRFQNPNTFRHRGSLANTDLEWIGLLTASRSAYIQITQTDSVIDRLDVKAHQDRALGEVMIGQMDLHQHGRSPLSSLSWLLFSLFSVKL